MDVVASRSVLTDQAEVQSVCPKRVVLDRVGDKWTALVVGRLADGPKRHSHLASEIRSVATLTQKMLTQTLRNLERDGLVTRTVFASVPPRVDYALTDLGRSLIEPLAVLEQWAERHVDSILEAREKYDAT